VQSSLSGFPAQNSDTAEKYPLERWSLGRRRLQPEVLKKIAHGILRLSHSIRDQNKSIPRFHLAARTLKRCIRQQSHRNIPVRRPHYFPSANQQRLPRARIHILQVATSRLQPRQLAPVAYFGLLKYPPAFPVKK